MTWACWLIVAVAFVPVVFGVLHAIATELEWL
jgi:hypothetical protein